MRKIILLPIAISIISLTACSSSTVTEEQRTLSIEFSTENITETVTEPETEKEVTAEDFAPRDADEFAQNGTCSRSLTLTIKYENINAEVCSFINTSLSPVINGFKDMEFVGYSMVGGNDDIGVILIIHNPKSTEDVDKRTEEVRLAIEELWSNYKTEHNIVD